MKIALFLLPFLTLAFIPNAMSEGLEAEIKSGSYCEDSIFKRYKLIHKTDHQMIKFAPSKKLLEFVATMELMCPWSVQRDFNGDKREDWIGYVKSKKKYHLIAYMSGIRNYTLQAISESKELPNNNLLRWIQTKHLKTFTDKKLKIGASKYALQVSNIEGMTNIYLWNGKQLEKVITTSQIH